MLARRKILINQTATRKKPEISCEPTANHLPPLHPTLLEAQHQNSVLGLGYFSLNSNSLLRKQARNKGNIKRHIKYIYLIIIYHDNPFLFQRMNESIINLSFFLNKTRSKHCDKANEKSLNSNLYLRVVL